MPHRVDLGCAISFSMPLVEEPGIHHGDDQCVIEYEHVPSFAIQVTSV